MAKRGRPSGSTSFVRVDMAKLNELFKKQQHIPVSRVWLREQGYNLEDSKPVQITLTSRVDSLEESEEVSRIDLKFQS